MNDAEIKPIKEESTCEQKNGVAFDSTLRKDFDFYKYPTIIAHYSSCCTLK